MIGIVIVSHSARLAEGVCELAEQVAQGKVRLAAAGGTSDPQHPIGTDAFKVQQAIESVYSEEGVLVFADLGSAVLSAETAIEFLDEQRRAHVHLSSAPVVEGAVAAAAQAAAGAGLDEILGGAVAAAAQAAAGAGLEEILGGAGAVRAAAGPSAERVATVPNALGLHARPAARLVRLARRFQSRVTIENVTKAAGPFEASGINGMLALAARQGHRLRIRAQGPDAPRALAEIAAFIETGCGDTAQVPGVAASAGIAIGPLVRLHPAAPPGNARLADDPEAEWRRLLDAIEGAREETRALDEWARTHAGAQEAGIFDAQLLHLEDPAVLATAERLIRNDRASAESAWREAAAQLAARADDAADVASRVVRRLTGTRAGMAKLDRPSVLSAHDLTPSEVQQFDPKLVLGLCLEAGGASAHSVILARAIGIPVVTGLGPGIDALEDGTVVALDGELGEIWISPDADRIQALEARRSQWLANRQAADSTRQRPAATRDGRRITVLANISGVAEAAEAVERGAEGVGVLRTEFLFLDRAEAPSEEEQLEAYRAIAVALGGRPLVIRTLDAGGDKRLPYVEIGEEANPFLGWRGIRVTLGRRDLCRTQMRAILRAGAAHPVALLLPMVASLDELLESKSILAEVEEELEREGRAFRRKVPVGVMIEVPSAVAVAAELASEAAFFSIGTNDLIQYVMAADRTNARVSPLADPFQPAVLRTIRQAVEAGRAAGIEVTLCGELAADPLATALLIGMGLDEFSVSAPLIPGLKQSIARWSVPEAEGIAREALGMKSAAEVRRLLATFPARA